VATERIEVKGLDQALTNMRTLLADVQTKIARDALRQAGWVIARRMRAATYSTFIRRSGAIQRGFGVAVQHDFKDEELKAYVVQYPQNLRRLGKPGLQIAHWWRYLEFGTGPRRASRTPNFLSSGKFSKNSRVVVRQATALSRWAAAGNRGSVKERKWVRPAAAATTPAGIDVFRTVVLEEIEKAVTNYPK
jgi:HK97 gp10 family phage protein